MRTTLEIPDEEYELISYYAKSKGISKGRAAGELARKQLAPETVPSPATRLKRMKNGLLVLSGDGKRKLTSEMVYKALEEETF
jgi:hypothetical protein